MWKQDWLEWDTWVAPPRPRYTAPPPAQGVRFMLPFAWLRQASFAMLLVYAACCCGCVAGLAAVVAYMCELLLCHSEPRQQPGGSRHRHGMPQRWQARQGRRQVRRDGPPAVGTAGWQPGRVTYSSSEPESSSSDGDEEGARGAAERQRYRQWQQQQRGVAAQQRGSAHTRAAPRASQGGAMRRGLPRPQWSTATRAAEPPRRHRHTRAHYQSSNG